MEKVHVAGVKMCPFVLLETVLKLGHCPVEISFRQRQFVRVSSRWSQTPQLPPALLVPCCPQ